MRLSALDPLVARATSATIAPKKAPLVLHPVRLVLPYPPSVNRLYRVGRNGRPYKTEEHRAYMAAAGVSIGCVAPWPKNVGLSVDLVMYRPQKRGDIDNPLKALFDALNGRAWCDDSQVEHLEATRLDDAENPRVEIWLRQWKP